MAGRTGFERFYGFLGAETNQWYPDLVYDNHPVEQPKSPEEGYHLTEDLTDKALEFIRDARAVAPDKPFFLYYCPGACHAPHHAPKEWIEKYRGKFDHLEESGQLDNTIIVLVSDNGASGEGGPNGSVNENKMFNGIPDTIEANLPHLDELGSPATYNHYPTGWAIAFNTPFKLWKRYSNWEGGTADPMIVSWPARISSSGVRRQYVRTLTLRVGEEPVGQGRIRTQPGKFSIAGEGLAIGKDTGEPVTADYPGQAPWRFTGGTIHRAAVDVSGQPFVDLAAEVRMAFMRD